MRTAAWAAVAAAALCAAPVAAQEEVAVPQTGVDPRPRRGVWAEATLGMFTAVGGSQALSNGQPYLGMMVGRDLGELGSIFLSLGIGAASASCFDTTANCTAASNAAPDSFSAAYLEGGFSYAIELANRLRLSGRLMAGVTQLAPGPVKDNGAVPNSVYGPHGGVGVGIDYDTRLDHFAVGLDLVGRYTVASGVSLLSLAVLPRLRYVF